MITFNTLIQTFKSNYFIDNSSKTHLTCLSKSETLCSKLGPMDQFSIVGFRVPNLPGKLLFLLGKVKNYASFNYANNNNN